MKIVSSEYSIVEAITRDLVLSDEHLEEVSALLMTEFYLGLSKKTHHRAALGMFPTYVRDVPNGQEEGRFLALDLGGTNFRVLLIDLKGDKFHMENEIYAIPKEIMHGSGEQLFDHIAECLAFFIVKRNIEDVCLPLGFTFSFPCQQEGLTKARLFKWTKGFKCAGVEGEDVVQLLREAIKRRSDIDIDVTAIVNDTTGTLMSCAHKNRECRIGLIVGTGTNACYMEKLDKVETWTEDKDEPSNVIVNTEWGAFGDNGVLEFVRTKWDLEVDANSLNPGKQLFEKMISGMYMGELLRCVLADLTKRKLLFNGIGSKALFTPFSFQTAFISFIDSDSKHSYVETRKALARLDLHNISNEDCEKIKLVSARVSTRAAYLIAAAVSTIIHKIRRPHTTIGVDGSVYRFHPHFHHLLNKKMTDLVDPAYKFDLMLSEDGSGRGAALVAAVAVRQAEAKNRL